MNFDRESTLYANRWIVDKKLVELTWGNVSCIDRETNQVFIKPSGVDLDNLKEQEISVLNLEGVLLDGKKQSVDTPTHLEIYKRFPQINCVIHTHSKYATIFSQSKKDIPCLGTTHADYFYGKIPCVDYTTPKQTLENYEEKTGKNICDWFNPSAYAGADPLEIGACLVSNHGVFCWDSTVKGALERAYVLEIVAEMAYKSLLLNNNSGMPKYLIDKHYLRKRGKNKYYGQ